MPKIIFFDIDNTLWDNHMQIPDSASRAIRELRASGHLPFICTGRARGNVRSEELLSLPFAGIVAACGNHIEYEGKLIYENLLPEDLLKESLEACIQYKLPLVIEGPVYHWIQDDQFQGDPYVAYMHQAMGNAAITFHGYEEGMRANKYSGEIMSGTDYEGLKKALNGKLSFIKHPGTIVEIVPIGTSKATGIQWICNYLNIPLEDTYAIGDSSNDLDMLRFVRHGIAMGNGTEEAKQAAEYVTDDIHKDGLYKAMKHYRLI